MAHHDMMHLESFAEFLEVFCTQNYSALSQSRFHRKNFLVWEVKKKNLDNTRCFSLKLLRDQSFDNTAMAHMGICADARGPEFSPRFILNFIVSLKV